MENREKALKALKELNIAYELAEHPAVYTIDEVKALNLPDLGISCKNLFLRDQKGKNHYLLTMRSDKKADLETIGNILGAGKLSFASENRLEKYLSLTKGAVTPLGIINDTECAVTVVFDEDLRDNKIGIHPNDNTATLWLDLCDLENLIAHYGNDIKYLKI
ncbi:MAG: prolyl-tRNA synthetase associated domain-containing protein [Defluviitaleaceae bacterium]|nr:prolyl-tRNA synthetase associated domain-containing protein [Defluviitaleaceae bacterium]